MRFQYVINTLSTATLQSAYVALTLNGVYDPLYSLGGGSCTGFAALMALYNRYIVSNVRVTMRLRNSSSSAPGNDLVMFIWEIPSAQTGLVGTVVSEDILEARRCSTCVIPYNSAFSYRELTRAVGIVELESIPSLVADYANLSGTGSSNPNRTPIALAGVCRPTGAQAGSTCEGVFVMEFDTVFYSPAAFTVS
jgi:hypothetical protein